MELFQVFVHVHKIMLSVHTLNYIVIYTVQPWPERSLVEQFSIMDVKNHEKCSIIKILYGTFIFMYPLKLNTGNPQILYNHSHCKNTRHFISSMDMTTSFDRLFV